MAGRLTAVFLVLAASTPAYGQLSLRSCRVAAAAARCGTLRVDEQPDLPSGRQLTLSIIVLTHTGELTREPVFVLAGGPGEAVTGQAESFGNWFASVRRSHDIVFLDQRGTGGDNRLSCAWAPRTFFIPADPPECLQDLTHRARLPDYDTEAFVQDLDSARKALGADRISVYAASYGTRAAYVYGRRYPARIRSLVLLAPAPISMPVLDSFAEDGQAAFHALIQDCLSDRPCRKDFPHLKSDAPKVRDVMDPYERLGLQFLLYRADTSRFVPYYVTQAAAGDRAPLDDAIEAFRGQLIEQLSLGLHLTIICSEDLPFSSARGAQAGSVLRREYADACQGWPRVPVSPQFHQSTTVAARALIVDGEWDPVTAPRWARVAARQFTHSQIAIVPKSGHIINEDSCLATVVRQFLDTGSADSRCLLHTTRPPYAHPDGRD